jgi:L-cystine transport system substrate-binding protein
MKKSFVGKMSITFVSALALVALAACSSSSDSSSASSEDSNVTTITVATGNDALPYAYLNEDDEYDGFDVKIVEAVDEKLADYKFEFMGGDFPTTLSNLESGKAMMAAYEYEVNDDRKEKFTYGTTGYVTWDTYIVTDGDKGAALDSFDQVKGKKIYVTTGTNQAAMAENYLKDNPDAFTLVYGEYTNEQTVEAIKSGAVDATLAPKYQVDLYNKNYGVNFVIGSDPVHKSDAYLLFNKDADADFQKAVNDAMDELKADGTILKLSEEYLGGDYVPKD